MANEILEKTMKAANWKPANMPQNMGQMDRIIRGTLGGMLFMSGLDHMRIGLWRNLSLGIGGAFIFYAVTGFDPLLSLFKTTTHPDQENNIARKFGSPKNQNLDGNGSATMADLVPLSAV